MATPTTPTLADKLDKIKSPGLQSQQKVGLALGLAIRCLAQN